MTFILCTGMLISCTKCNPVRLDLYPHVVLCSYCITVQYTAYILYSLTFLSGVNLAPCFYIWNFYDFPFTSKMFYRARNITCLMNLRESIVFLCVFLYSVYSTCSSYMDLMTIICLLLTISSFPTRQYESWFGAGA